MSTPTSDDDLAFIEAAAAETPRAQIRLGCTPRTRSTLDGEDIGDLAAEARRLRAEVADLWTDAEVAGERAIVATEAAAICDKAAAKWEARLAECFGRGDYTQRDVREARVEMAEDLAAEIRELARRAG